MPAVLLVALAASSLYFSFKSNPLLPPQINTDRTNFSPPLKDRKFWGSLNNPPPLYLIPSAPIKKMSPNELAWKLYLGTPTVLMNPSSPWVPLLNDIIRELCNRPWDISVIRPEGTLPSASLPEPINLNTCSIAGNIAATVSLLKDSLPKETIELAHYTINSRIINPYLEASTAYQKKLPILGDFTTKHQHTFWIGARDNWSAVCLANIAYASLAINSKTVNLPLIASVLRDIQPYLDSIETDGYFPGGIRYWEYGFGHFILLAETLYNATDGKLNLYDLPKVQSAIHFPMKTLIAQKNADSAEGVTQHLMFGDNTGVSTKNRWIWNILNRRFTTNYNIPTIPLPNLWYPSLPILDLTLSPPTKTLKKIKTNITSTVWFPTSGVLISHSPNKVITLAIKGNHNAEENKHNHNDVGSYTIFHNGKYLSGDPGSGKYEGAFGPDRYARAIESSWGHPVPVVDNQMQSTGIQFKAEVMDYQDSPDKTYVKYDLSKAYPVDGLISLIREASLDKTANAVTIKDSFEASRPILFQTCIIQGTTITNSQVPTITVKTSLPYTIKETYLEATQLFTAVRRVGISLEKNQTGWIEYTILPKSKNE